MTTSNEIWKPVVGYEGIYSVSSFGRVRRDLVLPGRRVGILKPYPNIHGYLTVCLCHKNAQKIITIHKLVAAAFIGAPPVFQDSRTEVNHKDGIKTNNRVGNLEYCTQYENYQHALKNGLMKPPYGESHCCAKLKNQDIPRIFELRAQGKLLREIAEIYKVDLTTIHYALSGRYWRKVVQELGGGEMNNLIKPGRIVRCTICDEPLSRAVMGVNAHLRSHIRKGELRRDDEQATRIKILGQKEIGSARAEK